MRIFAMRGAERINPFTTEMEDVYLPMRKLCDKALEGKPFDAFFVVI